MEVHDKIRVMREINQWSQEEMAEKLAMSANGYAKIERGQTNINIEKLKQIAQIFRGCTRLADMLPSKYEDNTLQIKEKKYRKNCFVFLYSKLPPVLPPIFWVSIPIRQSCSTAKSVWSSAIIWPWLPMRFLRALSSWTKAISADGVKADVVAVRQGKWLSSAF